jgi:hypothetical protein
MSQQMRTQDLTELIIDYVRQHEGSVDHRLVREHFSAQGLGTGQIAAATAYGAGQQTLLIDSRFFVSVPSAA